MTLGSTGAGRARPVACRDAGRHGLATVGVVAVLILCAGVVPGVSAAVTTDDDATRYESDAAGRQTAVIALVEGEAPAEPLIEVSRTEYEYDAAGRQTLVRDTLGRETRFEYDALGRRTRTLFADGTSTQTDYDTLGRRSAETDQCGTARDFEYDAQGRLTGVLLPEVDNPEPGQDGAPAAARVRPHYLYDYDLYGRLTTITDPKGRETSFAYDKLGRQLSRVLPERELVPGTPASAVSPTETQHYDSYGRLRFRFDFAGNVAGMRNVNNLLAISFWGDVKQKKVRGDDPEDVAAIVFGFELAEELQDPSKGGPAWARFTPALFRDKLGRYPDLHRMTDPCKALVAPALPYTLAEPPASARPIH